MWQIQILLCGTVQNFCQTFSLYSLLNPQMGRRTRRYRESDCMSPAPAVPLLGACPREIKSGVLLKTFPQMFTALAFTQTSSRNAIDRWINTLRFIPATGHLQQLRGTKARFMTRGLTLKTEASHRRPPGE